MEDARRLLRSIPSIEELLRHPDIVTLQEQMPRSVVTELLREATNQIRYSIQHQGLRSFEVSDIVTLAFIGAASARSRRAATVVNATGMVFHPDFRQAPLADAAILAMVKTASGYALRHNPFNEGAPSDARCAQLLRHLTGAQDALVTNSSSSAILLVLSTLGQGRNAVVSRGDLIESQDGVRVLDLADLARCALKAVGSVNSTHPYEYEDAIDDDTTLLLKVTTSSFRFAGEGETVSTKKLVALACAENERRHAARKAGKDVPEVIAYEDLAEGALMAADRPDCSPESVQMRIRHGADLVSCSGSKLVGGPEAGIVVGRADLIQRLRQNPLAKVVEASAATLSALEATLQLHLEVGADSRIPALRMLSGPQPQAAQRALALKRAILRQCPPGTVEAVVRTETSLAGGDALPSLYGESNVVEARLLRGCAEDALSYLRGSYTVPIVAKKRGESLVFDARTILTDEESAHIATALQRYLEGPTAIGAAATTATATTSAEPRRRERQSALRKAQGHAHQANR